MQFQPVAVGIESRLQIFTWRLASNRSQPMTKLTAAQSRLVIEERHQIATMPFHPADLVRRKIGFPTSQRLRADLRKIGFGGGISPPEFTRFRWSQHNRGIEAD